LLRGRKEFSHDSKLVRVMRNRSERINTRVLSPEPLRERAERNLVVAFRLNATQPFMNNSYIRKDFEPSLLDQDVNAKSAGKGNSACKIRHKTFLTFRGDFDT